MNKQPSYYTYAFAIIFLLILTLFLDSTIGSRIVTVITVSTAVLGAVSIFVQYKRDKNVNQATFILEYAKYFNSLNVEEAVNLLDQYRLGNKKKIKKINYNSVVNYLFWCEELSTLFQKGIVDFEAIDNLFSYTFFLITNNKYIQELELEPQAEFYKGIYYLHYAWTQYKRDTKQPIINEDESLEKVENYMQYVNKGDLSNKQTF